MSSPHDSPAVNDWFRRFDAASRHLPAEERASQREEIQQHLEGLVAAEVAQGESTEVAWAFALKQFGDPTQIGRKMYQEWHLGRTGFRTDMRAIFFGLGLAWLQSLLFPLWSVVRMLVVYFQGAGNPHGNAPPLTPEVYPVLGYGGTLLICIAIGRKYPLQAIKAAFYSSLLWNLVGFSEIVAIANFYPRTALPHPMMFMVLHNLLWLPVWALSHTTISYLASVTKRGWYKPTLADFKLAPPRRRPQISR